MVFVHEDDLKLCPAPRDISWNPGILTFKSLCASTVAFTLVTLHLHRMWVCAIGMI